MRGKMDCFGLSDTGLVRESNQDQFLIADLRKSLVIHHSSLGYDSPTEIPGASRAKLLMVADGMGGHYGGERASWLALEGITQYVLTSLHWPIQCERDHEVDFFRGLRSALEFSQSRIQAAAASNPAQGHMGTTLTMAWIVWPHTYLIHVGDSRAYLHRSGKLKQLSHDQTLAQALVDKGVVPPEEADTNGFAHILTSALGCTSNMEPLYSRLELQPDDKLLICSDGLNKHIEDKRIEQLITANQSAETTCQQLIQEANEAGGHDNTTVVLARFLPHAPEAEAHQTAAKQHPQAVASESI